MTELEKKLVLAGIEARIAKEKAARKGQAYKADAYYEVTECLIALLKNV